MDLLGFLSDLDFVNSTDPSIGEYKLWKSRVSVRAVLINYLDAEHTRYRSSTYSNNFN